MSNRDIFNKSSKISTKKVQIYFLTAIALLEKISIPELNELLKKIVTETEYPIGVGIRDIYGTHRPPITRIVAKLTDNILREASYENIIALLSYCRPSAVFKVTPNLESLRENARLTLAQQQDIRDIMHKLGLVAEISKTVIDKPHIRALLDILEIRPLNSIHRDFHYWIPRLSLAIEYAQKYLDGNDIIEELMKQLESVCYSTLESLADRYKNLSFIISSFEAIIFYINVIKIQDRLYAKMGEVLTDRAIKDSANVELPVSDSPLQLEELDSAPTDFKSIPITLFQKQAYALWNNISDPHNLLPEQNLMIVLNFAGRGFEIAERSIMKFAMAIIDMETTGLKKIKKLEQAVQKANEDLNQKKNTLSRLVRESADRFVAGESRIGESIIAKENELNKAIKEDSNMVELLEKQLQLAQSEVKPIQADATTVRALLVGLVHKSHERDPLFILPSLLAPSSCDELDIKIKPEEQKKRPLTHYTKSEAPILERSHLSPLGAIGRFSKTSYRVADRLPERRGIAGQRPKL